MSLDHAAAAPDARTDELAAHLAGVRERAARAALDAGRDPDELTLVAVTKFFPAEDVLRLVHLGVRHVGENRDQEAGPKLQRLEALEPGARDDVAMHFVGQLQTNKANRVARYADVVQSVDRVRLAQALDRGTALALDQGGRHGPLQVTLQVDLGEGEDAGRGGVLPADLPALVEAVEQAEHLVLRGLMAVAPLGLRADGTRAAFDRLAAFGERLRADHPHADILSMGMSGDLEAAVAAGATHLRVGTAILGSRPNPR